MTILDNDRGYARLLNDAQAVVDAVTMDDSGMLVGTIWQGGNGGLLSRDTLKAVDRLRLTISQVRSNARDLLTTQAQDQGLYDTTGGGE